jgi:hypothetical protein
MMFNASFHQRNTPSTGHPDILGLLDIPRRQRQSAKLTTLRTARS